MIDAARTFWTPTVCCVQPTAYTIAEVRSRPEFSHSARGDLEEILARAPADLLDQLGRVAREVPPDELKDAVLVLHGLVDVGRLAAGELHAVGAVGLLARDVGLLL